MCKRSCCCLSSLILKRNQKKNVLAHNIIFPSNNFKFKTEERETKSSLAQLFSALSRTFFYLSFLKSTKILWRSLLLSERSFVDNLGLNDLLCIESETYSILSLLSLFSQDESRTAVGRKGIKDCKSCEWFFWDFPFSCRLELDSNRTVKIDEFPSTIDID